MKHYLNKEFLQSNKQLVVKAVAIVVMIVAAFFVFVLHGNQTDEEPPPVQIEQQESPAIRGAASDTGESGTEENNVMESENASSIIVDVGGAVENPQVVELKENSRVADAISAAGGLKGIADTAGINQAAFVTDGEKVYIPAKGEAASPAAGVSQTQVPGSSSASGNGLSTSVLSGSQKVNINQASSEELQTLNGVGPATAEKIMAYRSSNGYFKTIEDIKSVDGIGDKTFEKLKEHITV